jgi:superfamily II DNA or RNA helicase
MGACVCQQSGTHSQVHCLSGRRRTRVLKTSAESPLSPPKEMIPLSPSASSDRPANSERETSLERHSPVPLPAAAAPAGAASGEGAGCTAEQLSASSYAEGTEGAVSLPVTAEVAAATAPLTVTLTSVELALTVPVTAVPLAEELSQEEWLLSFEPSLRSVPAWERPWNVSCRPVPLLTRPPWIRPLGRWKEEVGTQSWRFPQPEELLHPPRPRRETEEEGPVVGTVAAEPASALSRPARRTHLRPPSDMVVFKDRLLYLLQPPLEDVFAGRQLALPFQPYPYQLQGIAFLMPRHAALLADEMGLGKTAQCILALRLLLHAGLIRRALLVCPKPLVLNWARELRLWAEDVPFEIIAGDAAARRAAWFVSRCPVKLVNYEILTRDEDWLTRGELHFDLVVLDEAQRIKNRDSKTAQVVCRLPRQRSWALTGTPIENRSEDLVNLFAFLDPERIPPQTPPKLLPELTRDCILRRVKEDVAQDMPPKIIRDTYLELTPAQRQAYELAEKEGVVRLNALGETITVQHVFELVMRLKQICNFDPLTGQSAKLEQLQADLAEVAESGRKAIVFSQWVAPLEKLAQALADFGPLLYHGKIPATQRQAVLERFRQDPDKHVLLMSYGTGSVGLNLQCSNYVFLFDRWWNPAVEDQAINRAHRLGQKEPVFVTRFITQGTIEERIAQILEKKRQLFQEMLGQNEPPPPLGLTEEEIFGLFDIQARPQRLAA